MNDESLIVCVQDYPNLYDQSHSKYHDNNVKMNSWKEIGLQLNQSADQCRLRWKSLRECYRKALKKRETKSGQASKKIKPWRLEQQMEFLKRFVTAQRDQESNISEDESDIVDESIQEPDNTETVEITLVEPSGEISTGDTTNVKSKPSNKRSSHGSTLTWKKPKSMTPTAAVFQEYVNFKKQQSNNKSLEMRQGDHLTKYFQGVEETVRTMPKEIQIRVKSKISQIVHEAELEAIYVTPNVDHSHQRSSDLQQSVPYYSEGDYRRPQEGRLDGVNQDSPTPSHESSSYSCLSPGSSNYLTSPDDGTKIMHL